MNNLRFNNTIILISLIIIAFILAIRVVYLFLADPLRFPVNTVKIIAPFEHVPRTDLENIISAYQQESFFIVSLEKLKKDLLNINWAEDVVIERIWPDSIKIKFKEKQAVGIWQDQFITADGQLYPIIPNQSDFNLPKFNGPDNHHLKVLQIYQKLSKLLKTHGLIATSLTLNDNQNWELQLSNGILLYLGQEDLELRLGRFFNAYLIVLKDKKDLNALVDMRFPHGMTIKWNQ